MVRRFPKKRYRNPHRKKNSHKKSHYEYDPYRAIQMPFTCKFCGRQFDLEHRLPENHNCESLKEWKEHKWKNVAKNFESTAPERNKTENNTLPIVHATSSNYSHQDSKPKKSGIKMPNLGFRRTIRRLSKIPWWVVIIIIIAAFVAMNQIYIPYKTVPVNNPMVFCENDTIKLKNNMLGLGEFSFQLQAGVTCIEYKTSRCAPICENNMPSCRCESTILDRIISHPGEWLLGS